MTPFKRLSSVEEEGSLALGIPNRPDEKAASSLTRLWSLEEHSRELHNLILFVQIGSILRNIFAMSRNVREFDWIANNVHNFRSVT